MDNHFSLEIKKRIEKVQNLIIKLEAEACIISTSVNQYYLNGFIFDGYIYITPNEKPVIFIKRPLGIEGERIEYIRKPEQIPDILKTYNFSLPKRLLLESEQLSFSTATRLQAALQMPEIVNISGKLRKIRSIKSEYEIEQVRECSKIHTTVYNQIPSIYRKGMTDIEFQIELERIMRLSGSIGIFRSYGDNMDIFMGSILAGDNAQSASPYDFALGGKGTSPLLPLGASGTPLTPGITLMVDMAGNYRPYMDDMTRTFAIEYAPDIAYKTHQISIDIHNHIIATAKAGTSCADIYNIALEIVKDNNVEDYFMGTSQQAKFIGHGVGLEINEPPVFTPRSKEVLLPGMTIALEPKFVLPGIGATGIENTYIVHEDGLEKITLCEENLKTL